MLSADVAFEAQNADVGISINESLNAANSVGICNLCLAAFKQILSLVFRVIAGRVIRSVKQAESIFAASAR
jgi:hypothetical protein